MLWCPRVPALSVLPRRSGDCCADAQRRSTEPAWLGLSLTPGTDHSDTRTCRQTVLCYFRKFPGTAHDGAPGRRFSAPRNFKVSIATEADRMSRILCSLLEPGDPVALQPKRR